MSCINFKYEWNGLPLEVEAELADNGRDADHDGPSEPSDVTHIEARLAGDDVAIDVNNIYNQHSMSLYHILEQKTLEEYYRG